MRSNIARFRKFSWAALLLVSVHFAQAQKQPVDYVDPYIGSGGHGHVFVGASVPFGAIQVGPNNIYKGWDWCSGYHYSDSIVTGFAHTHLSGTGCSDMGDILLMPYTGQPETSLGHQKDISHSASSYYTHANEKVAPGYYSLLMNNGVKVELTATERVALHHYQFPADKEAHVTINLNDANGDEAYDTYLKQVDAYTIEGYRWSKGWSPDHAIFFTLKSDFPIARLLVYNIDTPAGEKELKAKGVKGVLCFSKAPADLRLKVGISSVSCSNALANITAEMPGWDFQPVLLAARKKWNSQLSKFSIDAATEAEKTIFYTAFYHTMIAPGLYSDHNGDFRGHDKKVYTHNSWINYSTFSLWDTYRTGAELYTLTQPERVNDMVNSMLGIYDQQGKLPIWPLTGGETNQMPGYSAVPVIADAYLKGFKGFNATRALTAMKNSATYNKQDGVPEVMQLGYIPADKMHEATSIAMEYAVDDWCLSLAAKRIGNMEDYAYFQKRGNYYKTYFDTTIHFVRPKLADGSWRTPYSPVKSIHGVGDFTEGTGWQYTFFAPQDPTGLIRLFGGDRAFTNKLDSLFLINEDMGPQASSDISGLIGQYAHGNEPSHHITYLYAYAGQQWKTAEKVRFIGRQFYTPATDGIIGNEDCGQMSSWYIMSAMGFYPVTPAGGLYVIGSPYFNKIALQLPGHKTFVVKAINNSTNNIYVQKVLLNGKPYTKAFIRHADIVKGGTLTFYMGPNPNKQFGSSLQDRPATLY